MSLLLDQPDQPRVHRLSVDAYHQLGESGLIGERVELLRGIIVEKMSKSPLHEFVTDKIAESLRKHFGDQFYVRHSGPITTQDSEPEPDITVVEGPMEKYLGGHPETALLAVEISVSTESVDEDKASIYAEASVGEYWMVRPVRRTITVFSQPSADGYRSRITLRDGDTLKLAALPGVEIAVSDIFPPRD